MMRVTAKAATNPTAETDPSKEHTLADHELKKTSPAVAPSAMRTPSSCVRCVTEYEITP